MSFAKGDLVECIDASDTLWKMGGCTHHLEQGRQYYVDRADELYVYLTGINFGWQRKRFVLVSKPGCTCDPNAWRCTCSK